MEVIEEMKIRRHEMARRGEDVRAMDSAIRKKAREGTPPRKRRPYAPRNLTAAILVIVSSDRGRQWSAVDVEWEIRKAVLVDEKFRRYSYKVICRAMVRMSKRGQLVEAVEHQGRDGTKFLHP